MFIGTRTKFTATDLDTPEAHHSCWESMCTLYNDSVNNQHNGALAGFGVNQDEPIIQIHLDVDEFKAVVEYIVPHYRKARNNKIVSGKHSSFQDFIDGKAWLLQFHNTLLEVGDTALQDCAYSTLLKVVYITSGPNKAGVNTVLQKLKPPSPNLS